ncbi:MAG: pyruvate kinase [Promethearchaeota archaeon]
MKNYLYKNNNKMIKLLCTLGPSSLKKEVVQILDTEGIDIFRINLSHTSIKKLPNIIKRLKNWTDKPLCLDTEGAQIRTGRFKNNTIKLTKDSIVKIFNFSQLGSKNQIPLYPINVYKTLKVGDILQLDFNSSMIQIITVSENEVLAYVLYGGKIGSNKAVSIDRFISLLPFTDKDKEALQIAKEFKINYIALSFASKGEDVKWIRDFFDYSVNIISKIESLNGINNLGGIANLSDAILIDRGDIGREVSLQKIGLLQRYIIQKLKFYRTPVYIATNLMDSMQINLYPNRAEINDITSCIEMGVSGLVMAAETAIGNHPIETVRMIKGIINETKNYIKFKDNQKELEFFSDPSGFSLIEPHGGVLVQNFIDDKKLKDINKIPSIKIDFSTLTDIYQISIGTYSPLRGFMGNDELRSVLFNNKLLSEDIWTLPILLQRKINSINVSRGDYLALRFDENNKIYALIKFNKIEKINLDSVAEKLFNTKDNNHPGVRMFKERGEFIISGEIFCLKNPPIFSGRHIFTPKQTRMIFSNLGIHTVVGFHTRNIIHRGHEYIQKEAVKRVNGEVLFISPVLGPKKTGDFNSDVILRSYEIMEKNNLYGSYRTFICPFFTYSRYSGPREAVFTAICRKNFGCSHFIVGRDHTGVADYYDKNASQEIFDNIGNIGIKIINFGTVYYCRKCMKVTENCAHSEKFRYDISASKLRKMLRIGGKDLNYLIRPEIKEFLELKIRNNENIYNK